MSNTDGLMRIQDVEVGDRLLTMNFDTGALEEDEVLCVHELTPETPVVRITTTGGCIECTDGHAFFTTGLWRSVNPEHTRRHVNVSRLEVGDELVTPEGRVEVTAIETIPYEDKVFDLTMSKNHNYLVSDCKAIAHNTTTGGQL